MKWRWCYSFKFCLIWKSYTLKWIHIGSPRKWVCAALKPASRAHRLAWRPYNIWPQGISGPCLFFLPPFTLLWLSGLPAAPWTLSSHPIQGLAAPIAWDNLPHLWQPPIQISAQISPHKLTYGEGRPPDHSDRSPFITLAKVLASIGLSTLLICFILFTTLTLQLPIILLIVSLTRK